MYAFGQAGFSIGRNSSGLLGTGLVLLDNGSNDLLIHDDVPFAFGAPLPDSAAYDVTVAAQSDDPDQSCTMINVSGGDVDDILVICLDGSTQERLLPPEKVGFGNLEAGQTDAGQALLFSNVGTAPLTVDFVQLTGPAAGDFDLLTDNCSSKEIAINIFGRILRILTRPIRRGSEHKRRMIQPFRGCGSHQRLSMMGRVFRQPGRGSIAPGGLFWRDLLRFFRRLLRRGARDQEVILEIGGKAYRSTTDRDGYFHFRVETEDPHGLAEGLNRVSLHLRDDPEVRAEAEILVASRRAGFVVVSDIDDTVMHTGVTNKLMMIWRLFATGAESRVAFPGVGDFYRALHAGPEGDQENPMLYVSRAPWSIYEMLEAFFRKHDIPVGPVLFLRDWGLTLQHPLPRRAVDHKRDLIGDMLDLYDWLPFVLIGDSGQHDPEVYADLVERHPGRIAAVYIRDVSGSKTRSGEIEQLAAAVRRSDCDLLLSDNTDHMIEHAHAQGLVAAQESD